MSQDSFDRSSQKCDLGVYITFMQCGECSSMVLSKEGKKFCPKCNSRLDSNLFPIPEDTPEQTLTPLSSSLENFKEKIHKVSLQSLEEHDFFALQEHCKLVQTLLKTMNAIHKYKTTFN